MKEQKRSAARSKSKSAASRSERSDNILDIERAHDPARITREARKQWEDSLAYQYPARLDRIYADLVKLLDSSTLHDEADGKTVREYVDLIRGNFVCPGCIRFTPDGLFPREAGTRAITRTTSPSSTTHRKKDKASPLARVGSEHSIRKQGHFK